MEFYIKVSQSGYISTTAHQKAIHFWAMGTLEGLLLCSDPRVHAWGGAGGKKLGHLKKCYTSFSCMLTPKDTMLEISHPYDMGFCVLR